ncbi:MAG: rhomboid family intramembrane serine protease [Flavisolibacter sp.]|jgi:rhomboid protease GluP|nr:rhomboid family intramembrane serine protease [Flavisolibacter sp.]
MSQHQEITAIEGLSQDEMILMSYVSFKNLGWDPRFAGTDRIIGYTKEKTKGDEVEVAVDGATLSVNSKKQSKNFWNNKRSQKKNVSDFLSAFEQVRSVGANHLRSWEHEFAQVQQNTMIAAEEERAHSEELEAVMNISQGSRMITYVIIGVNVLVFLLMVLNGVSFLQPTVNDLQQWGGNYKPLTTGGEWWRLITSVFVHVGVIHLLFNMYALFMIGNYLEPMLGRLRFLAAYIAAGILASVVSIWWNENNIISAGASGAVFGMYGLFLALLATALIPKKARMPLLQSIGVFIFYNLIYGAGAKGIDNAAHLGGLASGFLIGLAYYPALKNREAKSHVITALAVLVVSIAAAGFYVGGAKNDTLAYDRKIDAILVHQDSALAPLKITDGTELLKQVSTISQPHWQEAKKLIEATGAYVLPKILEEHRALMMEYIDLRLEHTNLIILALQGREDVNEELEAVVQKLNTIVAKMSAPKS